MNRVAGPVRNGRLHLAGGSLAVGGPDRDAVLWFRPEAVRITPDTGLQGTVKAATFLGATRRIEVDVGGPSAILIDAPAIPPVTVGGRIGLGIAPDAILELADEAAADIHSTHS
jgi:hypothetical protein